MKRSSDVLFVRNLSAFSFVFLFTVCLCGSVFSVIFMRSCGNLNRVFRIQLQCNDVFVRLSLSDRLGTIRKMSCCNCKQLTQTIISCVFFPAFFFFLKYRCYHYIFIHKTFFFHVGFSFFFSRSPCLRMPVVESVRSVCMCVFVFVCVHVKIFLFIELDR